MKDSLLRARRLLERKCFAIDEGTIQFYVDVIKSIDNEGAVNYVQDYINSAREYYQSNGIDYDGVQLHPSFTLYFDSKYSNQGPRTQQENVRPISDLLRFSMNAVGYVVDGESKVIDEEELDIDTNKEFVITFDEFKAMVEEEGLELEYQSFEDVLKAYRTSHEYAVCKIREAKNKEKNKIKELK